MCDFIKKDGTRCKRGTLCFQHDPQRTFKRVLTALAGVVVTLVMSLLVGWLQPGFNAWLTPHQTTNYVASTQPYGPSETLRTTDAVSVKVTRPNFLNPEPFDVTKIPLENPVK